ncbi:katanin p80 WD40 repeat-containing subunit B1 homolog [Asparagus officinalis]|uniref:katanin p80 WD40 repeat-containing subunit B1 homolog n=1 Tax=Asparagus officinalis TaxID=4686 RepID=UPI00098E63BE|nr:katanin p80 WD40 repeat-containing subunit B1 homolog [Asparagus officinalis]
MALKKKIVSRPRPTVAAAQSSLPASVTDSVAVSAAASSSRRCYHLLHPASVFFWGTQAMTVKTLNQKNRINVVRHFWECNGIKSAIDAVVKLPDYSVQVDVISVLLEKVDLFTLDIFSCLLPLLLGLLNSKADRHVTVSLELLFELVKRFGQIIQSTISASSSVGVDLQAEQRLERCKQCYTYLLKIKQILSLLIR